MFYYLCIFCLICFPNFSSTVPRTPTVPNRNGRSRSMEITVPRCAGIRISELQKPLNYTPYEGRHQLAIRTEDRDAGILYNLTNTVPSGTFIGYIQYPDQKRCVTVIQYSSDQLNDEYQNALNMLHQIKYDKNKKRKRLIEMIDAGELEKRKGAVIITELSTGSLVGFIYQQRNAPDEKAIIGVIRQKLLEPVIEMHQIPAVHMDLNPTNFVFVPEEFTGDSVIKLANFDGAKMLPFYEPVKPHLRANTPVMVPTRIVTPEYAAPEFWNQDHMITTKFDMWSLGIIIYEMILAQPKFFKDMDKPKKLQPTLIRIGDMYRGFRIDSDGNGNPAESIYTSKTWIDDNHDELMNILIVWKLCPTISFLLANLLHREARKTERLTAISSGQFLVGGCLIDELQKLRDFHELRLFHDWTFGELFDAIIQKRRKAQSGILSNVLGSDERYNQLLRRMEDLRMFVEPRLNELRSRGPIDYLFGYWFGRVCDTETTG